MHSIQEILAKLISIASVTPNDEGCQAYMMQHLAEMGFDCQRMDNAPVSNFFARIGVDEPCFVFAGHTDVVPVGDRQKWHTDPFVLSEKDGMLFGRGVADMKGSLACMLVAAERFIANHPRFTGSLGFLITSGEEGDDYHLGTPYVMAQLKAINIHPTYCIVGEPSSTRFIGDVIKVGRRGSLNAKLTLHGKQGHVAYPHLAENAIHLFSPALLAMSTKQWDSGNDYFPPSTLQITHIQAGGHANNIIPGELTAHFNIRYSTEQTESTIKSTIEACFQEYGLKPDITWRLSGEPFLTAKGKLVDSCIKAIQKHTKLTPELSTSGGTSDGRFIAPYGVEVVELGPVNATIHQVNECVSKADLEILADLYYEICVSLLIN